MHLVCPKHVRSFLVLGILKVILLRTDPVVTDAMRFILELFMAAADISCVSRWTSKVQKPNVLSIQTDCW